MSGARAHGFLDVPDLAAQVERAAHYVYAAYDGEFLKVGKSRNHPHQRVADLATGNPRVLRLLAWTVTLTERQAHRRLYRWRVRGEWFRAAPAVLEEIAAWTWLDEGLLAELAAAVFRRRRDVPAGW
jgi:hypothetical protein